MDNKYYYEYYHGIGYNVHSPRSDMDVDTVMNNIYTNMKLLYNSYTRWIIPVNLVVNKGQH